MPEKVYNYYIVYKVASQKTEKDTFQIMNEVKSIRDIMDLKEEIAIHCEHSVNAKDILIINMVKLDEYVF